MPPTWTALSLSSLWYVRTFPLSTKKRSCQFFTMDLCFFSQPVFRGFSMDLFKPVWVDPGLPSPGITLLERAEWKPITAENKTRAHRGVQDLQTVKSPFAEVFSESIFISWKHHSVVMSVVTAWTQQLPAWQTFADWLWLS